MQKFVLSTSAWLEKIAKIEVEKQGGKIVEVVDRLITFEGTIETAAKVNLWSRVGNKVFMLLAEEEGIEDFDDLYWLVNMIDFKSLIPENSPIVVNATSLRSELHHTPTIQSVSKKAIVDNLLNSPLLDKRGAGGELHEDSEKTKFSVLVLFINNKARVLLNLSWDALHKRWYRVEAWEAPIKESLAAGLVLLSGWRFKENFYDIFCGSWTICIEAALIARNIAPWLKREFSMVDLNLISRETMLDLKEEARSKKYDWEYRIFGSDIDNELVWVASENAKRAWVEDSVHFEQKDFRKALFNFVSHWEEPTGTLVSNPPYWLRIWEEEKLEGLYKSIDSLFRKNSKLWWGFISNYEEFDNFAQKNFYKKRKLYNWAEKCYFWKKK